LQIPALAKIMEAACILYGIMMETLWGIEGHLGAPKLVPFLLPPPQQESEGRGDNFSLAITFLNVDNKTRGGV
jgi:hypothetical protein